MSALLRPDPIVRREVFFCPTAGGLVRVNPNFAAYAEAVGFAPRVWRDESQGGPSWTFAAVRRCGIVWGPLPGRRQYASEDDAWYGACVEAVRQAFSAQSAPDRADWNRMDLREQIRALVASTSLVARAA